MVKRFFVLGLLCQLWLNGKAQDHDFYIGAFASPDYSKLSGLNTDQIQFDIGFTAGAEGKAWLTDNIMLSVGLQYSRKAYKTSEIDLPNPLYDPSLPYSVQTYYKDNYIEIPVRIDFMRYLIEEKVALFSTTGGSLNMFINESSKMVLSYSDGDRISTQTYKPDLAPVNLQTHFGLGVDIDMGKSRLQVYPLGKLSLTPIDKRSISANRFFSVGLCVGYFIGI